MRAHEIVDEYTITHVPPPDQKHFKFADQLMQSKNSFLKPVQTPMSQIFDVMHFPGTGEHGRKLDKYYFFAKSGKTPGKCVGLFFVEHVPPNPNGPIARALQPGTEIATPHMSLAPEFQRAGIALQCYSTFLASGKWVFLTKEHTQSANALWNRLVTAGNLSVYLGKSQSGEWVTSQDPIPNGHRMLGPKERFNLGTAI